MEAHADELRRKAVAYVNSDSNSRGFLSAGGSHTLEPFVDEITRDVVDPQTKVSVLERKRAHLELHGPAEAAKDVRERGALRLAALGSGSDFTPFLQHLGVASLNIGFDGESAGGSYHSIYDSIGHYLRFGDLRIWTRVLTATETELLYLGAEVTLTQRYEKVVQEDLNIGTDTVWVTAPGSGKLLSTQIGLHSVARGQKEYTAAWTPGAIAAGSKASTTVAVTDAAIGDFVLASHDKMLTSDLRISGNVSASGTAQVVIHNPTASSVTVAAGTVSVLVFQFNGPSAARANITGTVTFDEFPYGAAPGPAWPSITVSLDLDGVPWAPSARWSSRPTLGLSPRAFCALVARHPVDRLCGVDEAQIHGRLAPRRIDRDHLPPRLPRLLGPAHRITGQAELDPALDELEAEVEDALEFLERLERQAGLAQGDAEAVADVVVGRTAVEGLAVLLDRLAAQAGAGQCVGEGSLLIGELAAGRRIETAGPGSRELARPFGEVPGLWL